jgi:predicted permease
MLSDIRYAIRGLRRSPLFAASVAATIGLGLGILCSAFIILDAWILKPVDLPDAKALYGLSWDTATVTRHRFTLDDVEDLRSAAPSLAGVTAGQEATVIVNDVPMTGLLVTGNHFDVLGARPALGRLLNQADATAPGERPVVVLSDGAWRVRYGADPSIVGKQIALGRQRFDVVGVTPPGFGLPSQDGVAFWAPLTMSRAFLPSDPWADRSTPSLFVVIRLGAGGTESQVRAWLDVWLHQRFPAGSDSAPVAVRVESQATRVPPSATGRTLLVLLMGVFSLVLLVACANVTNLLLARALGRQRELAVRLSLGATRWRIARQLTTESLALAVPAAAAGLAITIATGRMVPTLIAATVPSGLRPVEAMMLPIEPSVRVLTLLCIATVVSAVLVTLAPALRVTRANLVRASKGESALDTRRSRLRTGLVAMQIAACVLFIVGAMGLIDQSTRLANPDPRLHYENVSSVRVAPDLRVAVANRLRSDPAVEQVAAAWRPPLVSPLRPIGVVASGTRIEQNAGFMVVSPEYFRLFDIRIVRGRNFTELEGDENAPLVLVSEATARTLWPGLDPIGQTLELVPPRTPASERRPAHTSVRVIGVVNDVVNGPLITGLDPTCIYFATGLRSPGELSVLVRGGTTGSPLKDAITEAVTTIQPDAPVQILALRDFVGFIAWAFQAFSATASILGIVGLVLAFSGTYAVVAFLVTQRTREFGIRMALGATVRQIVQAMLREMLGTASIGLAAGLAVALALGRAFSGTIPIIPAFSPGPYAIGTFIVVAATLVAALLPSLRAARIDPSKALRVD